MNKVVKSKYSTLIIAAIFAIALVGVFLFVNSIRANNLMQTVNRNTTLDAQNIGKNTLLIGSPNAKATIIEYADFKCPECGKFHTEAGKKIRETYVDTGLVNIVFRPFPVFSEDGAKALAGSYCAQSQGKFVDYHDSLFAYMWDNFYQKKDYQKAVDIVLTDDVIKGIVTKIGIDFTEYSNCISAPETLEAYSADVDLAAPDEIQGTPSFVIGGQKIVGNQPYSVFETLINLQLR